MLRILCFDDVTSRSNNKLKLNKSHVAGMQGRQDSRREVRLEKGVRTYDACFVGLVSIFSYPKSKGANKGSYAETDLITSPFQ